LVQPFMLPPVNVRPHVAVDAVHSSMSTQDSLRVAELISEKPEPQVQL
jgi:hypothetical protein